MNSRYTHIVRIVLLAVLCVLTLTLPHAASAATLTEVEFSDEDFSDLSDLLVSDDGAYLYNLYYVKGLFGNGEEHVCRIDLSDYSVTHTRNLEKKYMPVFEKDSAGNLVLGLSDSDWLHSEQIGCELRFLDKDDLTEIASYPLDASPADYLEVGDNKAYVLCTSGSLGSSLAVIEDGRVVKKIDLGELSSNNIVIAGNRLLAGSAFNNRIFVIDMDRNRIVNRIETSGWPRWLTYDPGRNVVYGSASAEKTGLVCEVDVATLRETGGYQTIPGGSYWKIHVNLNSQLILESSNITPEGRIGYSTLAIFDPVKKAVVDSIEAEPSHIGNRLMFDEENSLLFWAPLGDEGRTDCHSIQIFDSNDLSLIERLTIDVAEVNRFSGEALSPITKKAYFSDSEENKLYVISY